MPLPRSDKLAATTDMLAIGGPLRPSALLRNAQNAVARDIQVLTVGDLGGGRPTLGKPARTSPIAANELPVLDRLDLQVQVDPPLAHGPGGPS